MTKKQKVIADHCLCADIVSIALICISLQNKKDGGTPTTLRRAHHLPRVLSLRRSLPPLPCSSRPHPRAILTTRCLSATRAWWHSDDGNDRRSNVLHDRSSQPDRCNEHKCRCFRSLERLLFRASAKQAVRQGICHARPKRYRRLCRSAPSRPTAILLIRYAIFSRMQ